MAVSGNLSSMGKFCCPPQTGTKYWVPAYIAQSGDSWSSIANAFYGCGDACCAESLSYQNTVQNDAPLDVGQVVGLPSALGPCGGDFIAIKCINVPPQADLAVVTVPPAWFSGNVPVCGLDTC